MGDYLDSILVIAGTAIIIGLIFLLANRKKQQKESVIQNLATAQGWQYQKVNAVNKDGYVLQGDGWIFESLAITSSNPSESGSSSVLYSNRWFSDRFTSTRGLVMIGPKLPEEILGGFADLFLQEAIQQLLGEDAAEAEGLHRVEAGRTSFQERYSVFAVDETAVDKVLTFNVENALLNWQLSDKPIVKVLSRGTEIRIKDGRVEKPEEITAVIGLGRAFLDS